MISSALLSFITLASAVSATPTPSILTNRARDSTAASAFKYLFTFGDSYSQTGFDIKLAKPSLSNPIGNPTFPGWTTSGGNNWLTYLTTIPSPSLLTYNFASGGATTSASLVTPYTSTVLSLIDQVSLFTSNLATSPHPSYANWISSDSLFGIWIGVNDVGNAWHTANWATLSQQIIDAYIGQVKKLYAGGARNFVFLSVPPIELTPLVLAENSASQTGVAEGVVRYNALLTTAIEAFVKNATGVKTWSVDTAPAFRTAVANPAAYGAKSATCYNADGVTCLWFNDYHPGQAIQKLVGKAVGDKVGV